MLLVAAASLAGCLGIRVRVVTKEEALANQIAGVLADLDADLAEYESVRGVDDEGKVTPKPERTPEAQRVIAAQERRQFNRDDVQRFLKEGSAGESNKGLLAFHATARTQSNAAYAAFVQTVIRQENEDRLAIMRRVIELSEDYTERDLPDIQAALARQNRDAAEPDTLVQLPDTQDANGRLVPGEWVKKKAVGGGE